MHEIDCRVLACFPCSSDDFKLHVVSEEYSEFMRLLYLK
jgi:hypothetical protein